jgi:hypothetical protein
MSPFKLWKDGVDTDFSMKVTVMRFFTPAIFFVTCYVASAVLAAQTPASAPAAETQPLKMPSAIMQPALDTLQQTISMLRPEKWKMSGAAREEAAANISSIRHDLEATLPSLLTSADGAPDSVTQVLPAYRNVEALYDVLLRVSETGSLFAPDQQSSALEEARAKLEVGRRELGERLQSAAVAREKQMHDLQAAVRAIPPPAPAPVCPLTPTPTKHKPRKKTTKKPTPAVAIPQSPAPATH